MPETATAKLLEELHLNLNDTVKVKLTEEGRLIYQRFMSDSDSADTNPLRSLDARKDADGYDCFQLYMLMAIFGKHIPSHTTMDLRGLPFETGFILVPNRYDVVIASLS
jgi:hypothetical protein